MQLATSSAALDHHFVRGEFTQLEWIDFAARSLAVDGVVFDLRHFPRLDVEYLAEVRKLCIDRGLTIAALGVDDLFERDEPALEACFALAATVGAPLVLAHPPASSDAPATAWREAARAGKVASRIAKRAGVVVAVVNRPDSLCANAADLKRLTKDVDSSWLRFAPDIATLPADEVQALAARAVVHVASAAGSPVDPAPRRGFLVLDQRDETISIGDHAKTVREYATRLTAIGR